jgi:benzoyl-CoA reductase/2-hydroxyglutaryl-CoA dehydratase subunit BcrC/BadD/HgdB
VSEPPPGAAEPRFASTRSRNLSFARENSAYNREWFQALRARVAAGEPLAYVNADLVPTEIFKAMDIPVVVNQWWGAVVAAKQKSADYLGRLNALGFRRGLCNYCSLGYAANLETDPEQAPWGGLPAPTVVVCGDVCNSGLKIFELWAQRFAIPLFKLESAVVDRPDVRDWQRRHRREWNDMLGTRTLDLLTAQYRELIGFLERETGRRFDMERLRRIMALSNEQEEYYFQTRELINHTHPAPLNIADQMPATMIPQWHRGEEWARDRARLFYEETRRRVEAGEGAVADEKVRLMWIGTGLWYNLDFYQYFEQQYGAVFVWSIYLSVAADAYPTYGEEDPLRTLAARLTKINVLLSLPPFNTQWYLDQIRAAGIDGVVSMGRDEETGCQSSFGTQYLVHQALEAAGVPLLKLDVDSADARGWDDAAVRARMSHFIEHDILGKRTR